MKCIYFCCLIDVQCTYPISFEKGGQFFGDVQRKSPFKHTIQVHARFDENIFSNKQKLAMVLRKISLK